MGVVRPLLIIHEQLGYQLCPWHDPACLAAGAHTTHHPYTRARGSHTSPYSRQAGMGCSIFRYARKVSLASHRLPVLQASTHITPAVARTGTAMCCIPVQLTTAGLFAWWLCCGWPCLHSCYTVCAGTLPLPRARPLSVTVPTAATYCCFCSLVLELPAGHYGGDGAVCGGVPHRLAGRLPGP
jgi:hypothetical protein